MVLGLITVIKNLSGGLNKFKEKDMGVKKALGDNKKFLLLSLALLVVSIFIMIATQSGLYSTLSPLENKKQAYTEPKQFLQEGVDYKITLTTGIGEINIDLFEDKASESVNSLLFLISERYYEGLTFHKVIKNFVIQTGDTTGDGNGNPGYSIALENANESFSDYDIGMANASQFFIVLPNSDKSEFNGKYSLVGKVTSGFAVIDSIAKAEVDSSYKPLNDIKIEYIQITE
ncbi:MAG: peptidylprolyl isomerase [Candidatus Dojkabacteria bacterium]|jgi:cyclophilin family peptidyl-prolyl cis-trans isomerase|nr:peptidylprolyl isomerase [Candidatus Dojkabacteria bacterium]